MYCNNWPNGCGKSTLLNLIGSISPDQGQIILNGKDVTKLKEEERAIYIGKVHQNPIWGIPFPNHFGKHSPGWQGEKFTLRRLIKRKNMDRYIELLESIDLGLENKLNTKK